MNVKTLPVNLPEACFMDCGHRTVVAKIVFTSDWDEEVSFGCT